MSFQSKKVLLGLFVGVSSLISSNLFAPLRVTPEQVAQLKKQIVQDIQKSKQKRAQEKPKIELIPVSSYTSSTSEGCLYSSGCTFSISSSEYPINKPLGQLREINKTSKPLETKTLWWHCFLCCCGKKDDQ